MPKTLVVYFSKTGEQYGVGEIQKGNTAILAEIIAKKTGAALFEIKVADDKYPDKYTSLVKYAQKEKQDNARPALVSKVDNIDQYDTIFLGYPNWCGDMPMPVYTFLESYDLKGKTIHRFCTHEGSGGVTKEDFAMYGHIPQTEPEEAEKQAAIWLSRIGF